LKFLTQDDNVEIGNNNIELLWKLFVSEPNLKSD
jgi:hypothetical protein